LGKQKFRVLALGAFVNSAPIEASVFRRRKAARVEMFSSRVGVFGRLELIAAG
jgi:hypothetical protein